ncbi:hypothetical protein [Granulicella sp. L46]|jgi:hypothetical protein|uniref:hypothetical protein n=1 Tax=Granulicella sp. L46 TaxID=1641865 RepID=UPI00131B2BBA|nr:hypothetical protein [Granulicella sp. L46]
MKTADKLASLGLVLTVVASAAGLVFQGPNLGIVNAAGWAQLLALLLVLVGVVRGSRWWLVSILLVAAGGYLWLLEQGH